MEDQIEVSRPGWGSLKVSGGAAVIILVSVIGFLVMGFMIRDSDARQMAFSTEARAERNLQNKENKELQNEANFIMAKCLSSKEECQKLQFDMPDSLRRKIGR